MDAPLDSLADYAAALDLAAAPEQVLHHAKLLVLDTLGVMLAGARRPEVSALREKVCGKGVASALMIGCPPRRADTRIAALLNGTAGRSIELCDGMRFVSSQPSVQIIPALLAISEAKDLSGADFLAALLAGYEVTGRIATGFRSRPTAHQNGQVPLLGAVAATCRLLRMTGPQMRDGLNMSAHLLMAPSYHAAVEGATALNIPGGMSCFAATLVPDMIGAGFTAQSNAVQEALSALVGDGFNPSGLLDDLGARWEITRNYFRMHACCNPIHPALDALENAIAAQPVAAQDVERIEIETFKFASVMCQSEPANWFASKYSLPHAAATLIVRGGTSHRELDESALDDPAIACLRRKVLVREDPTMTASTPIQKPARVRLFLKDGTQRTAEVFSHRGDWADPYPESVIRAKFRDLAGSGSNGSRQVMEDAIDQLELQPSMRHFMSLVETHCMTGVAI